MNVIRLSLFIVTALSNSYSNSSINFITHFQTNKKKNNTQIAKLYTITFEGNKSLA